MSRWQTSNVSLIIQLLNGRHLLLAITRLASISNELVSNIKNLKKHIDTVANHCNDDEKLCRQIKHVINYIN